MQAKTMQFVAELKDFKPRIWRRIQVSSDMAMEDFCYVLLEAFRAYGSHLYSFEKDDEIYELTINSEYDAVDFMETSDIKEYRVADLFHAEKEKGYLNYDFGDGWEFKVTLEKSRVPDAAEEDLPQIIKGKGYGIIEDCGGVWGLSDINEALKTRKGEEWKSLKNWLEPAVLKMQDLTGFSQEDMDELNENIRESSLKEIYNMREEDMADPQVVPVSIPESRKALLKSGEDFADQDDFDPFEESEDSEEELALKIEISQLVNNYGLPAVVEEMMQLTQLLTIGFDEKKLDREIKKMMKDFPED